MSLAGERLFSFVNGWSKSLSLVFPSANYTLPPPFFMPSVLHLLLLTVKTSIGLKPPPQNRGFLNIINFVCKLRDHLALLGNNPTLYAGHSFRRGGVTFAYQSGVLIEPIKALGDWRSDTILIYTSPCL